jgi:hypothetical protein
MLLRAIDHESSNHGSDGAQNGGDDCGLHESTLENSTAWLSRSADTSRNGNRSRGK